MQQEGESIETQAPPPPEATPAQSDAQPSKLIQADFSVGRATLADGRTITTEAGATSAAPAEATSVASQDTGQAVEPASAGISVAEGTLPPAAAPEAQLTPEQLEQQRLQLTEEILSEVGGNRAEQAGDPNQNAAMRELLKDKTPAELEEIKAELATRVGEFRTVIATKVTSEGEDPQKVLEQLQALDLQVSDVAELHNLMAVLPEGNPAAAKDELAAGIKEIMSRQASKILGESVDPKALEDIMRKFDQAYGDEQDLQSALAFLVSMKTVAESGLEPEKVQKFLQLGHGGSVELSDQEKQELAQLRDRIIFGLAAWAKSSYEESDWGKFLQNFFGNPDSFGGYGRRNAELWKPAEGEDEVPLEEIKKNMKEPKAVAKALVTAYTVGYGTGDTALRLKGLHLSNFDQLMAAQENGDLSAVKTALNEVLTWLFKSGESAQLLAAQRAWNEIFPRVLLGKDKKVLGEKGMDWFSQQNNKPEDKRWDDLEWPAVQEQAAQAA